MAHALVQDKNMALYGLISYTNDAILQVRQNELKDFGINHIRSAVLSTIYRVGSGITVGQLTHYILRRPHSMSELLTSMEKEGLITKTRDKNAQNVVHLALTEKGIKTYKKILRAVSINKLMDTLSEEECKQLEAIFTKLLAACLRDLGDAAPPPPPWLSMK